MQKVELPLGRVKEASLVINRELAGARVHTGADVDTEHAHTVAALTSDLFDAVERLGAANDNLDNFLGQRRSAGVQVDDHLHSPAFTGTAQPCAEGINALRDVTRRMAQGIAVAKLAR